MKDAVIPSDRYPALYAELILAMRKMYRACRLVHADLSEYNILYHKSHLYLIDVSQSVEHDHPAAFDFLRSDIRNVEEYFEKRGCETLGLRGTFEFVTCERLVPAEKGEEGGWGDKGKEAAGLGLGMVESDDVMEDAFEAMLVARRLQGEAYEEAQADATALAHSLPHNNNRPSAPAQETFAQKSAAEDALFAQSFIPRTLDDVYDPERDVAKIRRGEGRDLIYADVTGIVDINDDAGTVVEKSGGEKKSSKGKAGVAFVEGDLDASEEPESAQIGSGSDSGSESGSEDSEEESENPDGTPRERRPRVSRGHRNEDRDIKKVRVILTSHPAHRILTETLNGDYRSVSSQRRRRNGRSERPRCPRRRRSAR